MEMDDRELAARQRNQRVAGCVKKVATFLFSNIGLAAMVIGYSIMGGFLFQALEAPFENKEKLRVQNIREEKIVHILKLARHLRLDRLDQSNFTEEVRRLLIDYKDHLTVAIKKNGWDGNDEMDETQLQWSFAGSLLYAVTVITTIGYGHVAPKTVAGRLITIVYALVGIPLTFLYLSTIGNFMAECFRLFYKKICCCICIYCHKRKRAQQRLAAERAESPTRATGRRVEFAIQENRAFDESEMDDGGNPCKFGQIKVEVERKPSTTEMKNESKNKNEDEIKAMQTRDNASDNYAVPTGSGVEDEIIEIETNAPSNDSQNSKDKLNKKNSSKKGERNDLKRYKDFLSSEENLSGSKPRVNFRFDDDDSISSGENKTPAENAAQKKKSRTSISNAETYHRRPSFGIQSKQHYNVQGSELDEFEDEKVTVPITICLIIIALYIVGGALLFMQWENWDYLTGSYFCFITLITIGFGDIVPGTDMRGEWTKLVLCALWLALGLSLLAMCFNLMQEEVKEKCIWIGHKLGILKDDD